jgi:hypothetical protein
MLDILERSESMTYQCIPFADRLWHVAPSFSYPDPPPFVAVAAGQPVLPPIMTAPIMFLSLCNELMVTQNTLPIVPAHYQRAIIKRIVQGNTHGSHGFVLAIGTRNNIHQQGDPIVNHIRSHPFPLHRHGLPFLLAQKGQGL